MADKQQGRLYLEVIAGEDKGLTCWLNSDKPILIGTGEMVGLPLNSKEAKAEHAMVSIVKEQIWLENLSSSGTLLNGRVVRERAIILKDEIIGIGDDVKIALRETGARGSTEESSLLIPLLVIVLICGSILLAVITSKPNKKIKRLRPITSAQWNEAYKKINARLLRWVDEDRMNSAYQENFTQAWFRDQGGDEDGAVERWQEMYNGVLGLFIPGATPAGKTIANSAKDNPRALYILMGRVRGIDSDNSLSLTWKGDDASFANAWWWFINKRIDSLQKNKD